jgi:thioredoxin-like negative regulator of GroEL
MIAPMLDKLARDYAGRLRVAKVNVDENPHYAGIYGVQGIPTLLMVQDGAIVDRLVGALPEQYLRQKIKTML